MMTKEGKKIFMGHLNSSGSPDQVAQLVSVVPMCQICESGPRLGHVQKSTSDCMDRWSDRSMFLSLSKSINQSINSSGNGKAKASRSCCYLKGSAEVGKE